MFLNAYEQTSKLNTYVIQVFFTSGPIRAVEEETAGCCLTQPALVYLLQRRIYAPSCTNTGAVELCNSLVTSLRVYILSSTAN